MATLALFGTYDADAPRLARLKAGWRATGGSLVEVNEPLWPEGPTRATLSRQGARSTFARGLATEHRLWARRGELAGADALLVPYPGHLDMPLAAWLGRRLGVPVLFDPFLSLYDTAVGDRALVEAGSVRARAIGAIDRLSMGLADVVLADTEPMADYYRRVAGATHVAVVPVGADETLFRPTGRPGSGVLFYGRMIPLHGVPIIVEAARRLPDVPFHLVGSGQVDVEALIRESGAPNVRWTPEVAYAELPALVADSAVVLGIFGESEKASRVVPHKVYEAAAAGKAIVSADTPAMRLAFPETAIARVPAGDAAALAGAIAALLADPARRAALGEAAHARFTEAFSTRAVGEALRHACDLAGVPR